MERDRSRHTVVVLIDYGSQLAPQQYYFVLSVQNVVF